MKRTTWRVLLGCFITSAVLLVGYIVVWFWATGYPLMDPLPKGEGSYEELDDGIARFRRFYRTGNTGDLPPRFVRLTGYVDDPEPKETWMIYYATASHRTKRGGTILLMGSDGRIDGYFGHHCSKVNGGKVGLSASGHRHWHGGDFYERFNEVRDAFAASFKHQRTEQAVPSEGDPPTN